MVKGRLGTKARVQPRGALLRTAVGCASLALAQWGIAPAAAAPLKIMAIAHSDIDDFGNPADTVNFYDVTSIGAGGTNVFNANGDGYSDPLFSAWIGYEILSGDDMGVPAGNDEDPSAIAVNPANGTIYLAAYDSGVGLLNNPDQIGDNAGDWDLYRIDYQKLLADFVTNNRPKGTVYVKETQPIVRGDEQFMADSGSPLFDGAVDGFAHNIPHPDTLTPPAGLAARPSVVVPGAIVKAGELARSPSENLGISFFDSELKFLDPSTLVLMDTASNKTPAGDFQIRLWQRISTEPGQAVPDRDGLDNMENSFNPANPVNDDNQIGGRNHMHEGQFETTESWQATIVGRFGLDDGETLLPLEVDPFGSASNPRGLALVKRDGVVGVWFADADFGASGDDIAFYEINFSANPPTLVRRDLATSGGQFPTKLGLADNPSVDATTDDGEIDFLLVDKDGNLVIGESGYFDTTGDATPPLGNGGMSAQQPKIITVRIENYNRADTNGNGVNEVVPVGGAFNATGAYVVTGPVNPALVDDDEVINNPNQTDDNADVAYDKGTGYIYFIDRDVGFFEDIYVFDPATGTLVYSELNAVNPGFFNNGSSLIFLRGDINDDGAVTAADISLLTAAIADPTQGGRYTAAVGQELFDLTGDRLLTNDDLAELQAILGEVPGIPGDFDGNGVVNAADLEIWKAEFGDTLEGNDFLVWQRNLGAPGASPAQGVPEPASAALAGCAVAIGMGRSGCLVWRGRARRHMNPGGAYA